MHPTQDQAGEKEKKNRRLTDVVSNCPWRKEIRRFVATGPKNAISKEGHRRQNDETISQKKNEEKKNRSIGTPMMRIQKKHERHLRRQQNKQRKQTQESSRKKSRTSKVGHISGAGKKRKEKNGTGLHPPPGPGILQVEKRTPGHRPLMVPRRGINVNSYHAEGKSVYPLFSKLYLKGIPLRKKT